MAQFAAETETEADSEMEADKVGIMTIYHGTGSDRIAPILKQGPRMTPRAYLHGRAAFSTTTDFAIAKLFAIRRSPSSILHGDESKAGVVLEYRLNKQNGGWMQAKCEGVLQDEKEIAILSQKAIRLVAIWRLKGGSWCYRRRRSAKTIQ